MTLLGRMWCISWDKRWLLRKAVDYEDECVGNESVGKREDKIAALSTGNQFNSVQSLSPVWLFATPWIAARQASLSITISRSSLTHVLRVSDAIQPSHSLLSPFLPPSFRVFSSESTLHMRWPKYWSFSFRIIPSKKIPGLISFRMDLLDLLAVQGTLKSLLQHHSSKASILPCSAFFTVQTHIHTWPLKKTSLTRRTFVGNVSAFQYAI